ncbi:MAG: aminoglycoside phosphotransferase family protein [Chloroflexota bacterium]
MPLNLPKPVRAKIASQGKAGQRWLEQLPQIVAELAERWQLDVGQPLSGGSEGLVLPAQQADGTLAVLKIGIPNVSDLQKEARVFQLAAGRGYPDLLAQDEAHNAILLERLGQPLAESDLSIDAQITHICQTLKAAWIPLEESHGFPTGAEKADWLATFIATAWQSLGNPCLPETRNQALTFAEERRAAHDPANCVLVHGDAHAHNTLKTLDGGGSDYKFVDPDGLFAEPAYDLAIPMREWSEELLTGDAMQLGAERCRLLSELTGIEKRPIYQWGFIERVSTGLYLLQLGLTDLGQASLAVADLWATSKMDWE